MTQVFAQTGLSPFVIFIILVTFSSSSLISLCEENAKMGDFVSAGKFLKVAFLLAVNAMVLFLFALGTGLGSGFNDDGVDAMIVISILVCIVGEYVH